MGAWTTTSLTRNATLRRCLHFSYLQLSTDPVGLALASCSSAEGHYALYAPVLSDSLF